ncbi:MAG: hypothetical protein LBP53_03025 [Candidatus Peribacteria bacterium]|nr:hypothetical protein [Candidatus Peribacteria bacterium]
MKFQIAKKKQEEMEEETKIQERTTQLSAEAQLQRKKRLAFHKVKIRYSIAQEYIFEHIYGCK